MTARMVRVVLRHSGAAGVTAGALAPWVLLLCAAARTAAPLALYGGLLALLLTWHAALWLIARLELTEGGYRGAVGAAMILSTTLLLYGVLYPSMPFGESGWMALTVARMFDFRAGLSAELALVLVNLLLWQRAAVAQTRDYHFRALSQAVRVEWGLWLGGALLVQHFFAIEAGPVGAALFAAGLLALIMGRIDDASIGTPTEGLALPWERALQLIGIVALIVALGMGIAALLTPMRFAALLRWLDPALRTLILLAKQALVWIGYLVYPLIVLIFNGLTWLLSLVVKNLTIPTLPPLAAIEETLEQPLPLTWMNSLPPWVLYGARWGALLLLVMLALTFVRLTRPRKTVEVVEESAADGGVDVLRQARALLGMVRQFGLNRDLLAAISVQNLYANLCRLAAQRGCLRPAHWPPDRYLQPLTQAFPGYAAELTRITEAYMRVHYGDRPITPEELATLQADYRRIHREKNG